VACPAECDQCAANSLSNGCTKDEGHSDDHQCSEGHSWPQAPLQLPSDIIEGLKIESYPELKALNDSPDIDTWLSQVVGIDPSVLQDDNNQPAVS
jgi:hypothetical protein